MCAPVEGAVEDDDVLSACGGFRNLDRILQSFRARVGEVETVNRRRHDLANFFDQLQHRLVDDDVRLRMQEQASLLADRFDHLRVAVTRIRHANSAGEIQQFLAIVGVDV